MKWIKFILVAYFLLLMACSPINSLQPFDAQQANILIQGWMSHSAKQMIGIALPRSQCWLKTGKPVVLYPAGQNADNWREKIDTQMIAYKKVRDMNAMRLARLQIQQFSRDCSNASWKMTSITPQAVTYRLHVSACTQHAEYQQIAKIFNGIDGVYMVRYTAKTDCLSSSHIEQMATVIAAARLV